MPMGADFCYAAVAVMGGEYAARLLNFVMFSVICYLIFRCAQRFVSTGLAYFVAALFASAPGRTIGHRKHVRRELSRRSRDRAMVALWEFHQVAQRKFTLSVRLPDRVRNRLPIWRRRCRGSTASVLHLGRPQTWRTRAVAAAALFLLVPALQPYVNEYICPDRHTHLPVSKPVVSSPLIQESLIDYRFQQPLTWDPLRRSLYGSLLRRAKWVIRISVSVPCPYHLGRSVEAAGFEDALAVFGGLIAVLAILATQPNALPLPRTTARDGGWAAPSLSYVPTSTVVQSSVAALLCLGGINIWFLPTSNWFHRQTSTLSLFFMTGRIDYIRAILRSREVVSYLNGTTGGVLFVQNPDIAGAAPCVVNNLAQPILRKKVEILRTRQALLHHCTKSGYRALRQTEGRHGRRSREESYSV